MFVLTCQERLIKLLAIRMSTRNFMDRFVISVFVIVKITYFFQRMNVSMGAQDMLLSVLVRCPRTCRTPSFLPEMAKDKTKQAASRICCCTLHHNSVLHRATLTSKLCAQGQIHAQLWLQNWPWFWKLHVKSPKKKVQLKSQFLFHFATWPGVTT